MAVYYTERLIELKLATGKHYVHQSILRKALSYYYSDTMRDELIEIIFNLGSTTSYPQQLFYFKKALFHPLKHLILIAFLFDSVKEFSNYINRTPKTIRQTVNKPSTLPSPKIEIAVKALLKGISLRKVSKLTGLSVNKVKQLAISNNIEINRRESLIFESERKTIMLALEKGRKTSEIAQVMQCSIGVIEQILSQHPDIKVKRNFNIFNRKRVYARLKLIVTIKNINDEALTRSEVKRQASASYSWLYKFDKEWLYNHLPERLSYRYWPRK